MERITAINPERIKWCCADYGITPDDLASATNMSKTTMQKVMTAEDGMTYRQLQDIAQFFGRSVLFFVEQIDVDMDSVRTPQFRTLASQLPKVNGQLKKLIEGVERQRDVYIDICKQLDNYDNPVFSPPVIPSGNIHLAANITRKWLQLDALHDFRAYREAVEAKGVLVFCSNGYAGAWQVPKDSPILGFTIYDEMHPVIFIAKQAGSSTMQSFTLMHELGHLLLHKSSTIDDGDDMFSRRSDDRDANQFAGFVLVPDECLLGISDDHRPQDAARFDEWLKPQRAALGVSGEVILRRLMDAGRLTEGEYTAYREWRSQLTYTSPKGGARHRHSEPYNIFGGPFVRSVFSALNAQLITLAKASSYLDSIKIKDIHNLKRYCAGL